MAGVSTWKRFWGQTAPSARPESFLAYKNYRYLKLTLLGLLVAITAYAVHDPIGPPSGGTWLGYTLGGLSAFLILWLMWIGIRKRRFGPGTVNLTAWLSAHVYFGLTLIVVATLHTGFQFGLNVHTLAYALMILVIVSGIFGVYAYLRYPNEMTANRSGNTFGEILLQISDLDRQCRDIAMTLGDEINALVFKAGRDTVVGGGLFRQLSGHDPACPATAALAQVERLATATSGDDAASVRQVVTLLSRKCELLRRARRDVQFQALMQIWLFIHVPFSFALLAALIAHVIAVFFYW